MLADPIGAHPRRWSSESILSRAQSALEAIVETEDGRRSEEEELEKSKVPSGNLEIKQR